MLSPFWNWFVIIVTIVSILACWWLLHWTKGISEGEDGETDADTGHVWDHDIRELNYPLPRWWLHLFNITIVFSLVYLVLYPGLGNIPGVLDWTQLGKLENEMQAAEAEQAEVFARFEGMSAAQLATDPEARDIGRRLFGNHCAMCHGSDGRGAPGFPDLTDEEWQWGSSPEQIMTSISQGRAGVMPVLVAGMKYEEVLELAEYVKSLSDTTGSAGNDGAAKERYGMLCVACHGPDGKGNPALGAPDLTNNIWLYGGGTGDILETLTQGRTGNMPAHEFLLSEDRRRLLTAYVLGISGEDN